MEEFQEAINNMEKNHRPAITQYNARLTISRNASMVLNSFEFIGYRVVTTVIKKTTDSEEIVWTMHKDTANDVKKFGNFQFEKLN